MIPRILLTNRHPAMNGVDGADGEGDGKEDGLRSHWALVKHVLCEAPTTDVARRGDIRHSATTRSNRASSTPARREYIGIPKAKTARSPVGFGSPHRLRINNAVCALI